MNFEFATSHRILFGPGTLAQVAPAAKEMGHVALVVTGNDPSRAARLLEHFSKHQIAANPFSVSGEPSVGLVRRGVQEARQQGCDLVVALGGGSVIDAGKAIAALLKNSGDVVEYLEVIGPAKPLQGTSAPFIAIPTTAGTGAEVTRNAVLSSPEHQVKVSLRSYHMLPNLAIIDPELTYDLPRALTASTGMDALTQLIEPYLSKKANPLTDGFCVSGIPRIAGALRRAFENGRDSEAREAMSFGSLLGGMALANAGLGAVHGFAAPIGGQFPAPHGAICAALLPAVMRTNFVALKDRAPQSEPLRRFHTLAPLLTGDPHSRAEEGIRWVEKLCQDLSIPSLRTYGIGRGDFPELVEKARKASSMRGNPIDLTAEELHTILEESW